MIALEQRIVACALAALVAAVVVPPVAHLSLAAGVAVAIGALALSVPLAHLVPPSVAGAVTYAGGAAGSSAAIRGIRTPFVPSANHRCDID